MSNEISKLRIGFQIDNSQLEKGMGVVLQNLNLVKKEFSASMVGVDKFNKSLGDLETESTGLKRILQQQQIALASIQAQYNKTTKAQEDNAKRVKELKAKYDEAVASKNMDEKALQELKKEYEQAVKAKKADEKGMNSLHAKYIDMGTQIKKTEIQLDGVEKAIQDKIKADKEQERLLAKQNTWHGKLQKSLKASADGFSNLSKKMQSAGKSLSDVGGKMTSVSKAIGKVGFVAGGTVAAGFGFAIKKAADFEQGLDNVQSISGATKKQMGELHDEALRLGKDSVYSATQVTKAQEELVKSGLTIPQVLTETAGTLNLATAGELELADAANIAGVALNSFKDEGLTVAHVADQLAGAANASATDVMEMKYAISQSAAVAAGVGMTFDDLNTTLSVFANRGLIGSDAGTSLKTFLQRLIPTTKDAREAMSDLGLMFNNNEAGLKYLVERGIKPASNSYEDIEKAMKNYIAESQGIKKGSVKLNKEFEKVALKTGFVSSSFYDTNGNLKDMATIAGLLQKATKGLTKEQQQMYYNTIFGSDAIRAANITTKEGTKGFQKMAKEVKKVTAAQVAKTKLDNLKGSMEQLNGAVETVAIKFGEKFVPVIKKAVETITDYMPQIEKFATTFADKIQKMNWKKVIGDIGKFVKSVFPPLIEGFKNVGSFLGKLDGSTKTFLVTFGLLALSIGPVIAAVGTFITVLGAVMSPIGLIVAGIALVSFGIYQLVKHFDTVVNAIAKFGAFIGEVFSATVIVITGFIMKGAMALSEGFANIIISLLTFLGKFLAFLGKNLVKGLDVVANFVANMVVFFSNTWLKIVKGIGSFISKFVTNFKNGFSRVLSSVGLFLGSLGTKAWNGMKSVGSYFSRGVSLFVSYFGSLGSKIGNVVLKAISGLGSWIGKGWGSVKSGIDKIVDKIKGAFGDISLKNIGKHIIEGLGDGISSAWSYVKKKLDGVSEKIPDWLRKVLKIHSPSVVLEQQVGKFIPMGLAEGISKNIGYVQDATNKMALASIPSLPDVTVPSYAQNGVYGQAGSSTNVSNTYSPSVTINAVNNPFAVAQEQERLLRRMKFQGGIAR